MKPMKAPLVCSKATVIGFEGELTRVSVARGAMCDGCHQQDSCHVMLLDSGKNTEALVRNPLGAKIGDVVEVSMDERVMLKGGVMLYILPLVFMLAAIMLATYLKPWLAPDMGDNALALLAAVAGILISLPVIRIWSRRSKYMAENTPVITSILEEDE